jgi:parallel beta-helix repeat protein
VYSAGSPASMNMMISEVDTLLQFNGVQYVVVNGIEFEGANYAAVTFYNSNYITMENCSIKFSGRNAVGITTCNYLTFNNVRIDYTNNNGFFAYCNNSTIENCIVQRTAAFPGMNLPVNSGIGIYLVGNNNTVTHNTIDTTGYTAISFQGNSNTISNNFINYFCFVKDDGGGIYTWNGNSDSTNTHTTGWITNNIVLNGITAPAGTDSSVAGIAHGIYLDENTTECDVTGNTVANCTGGIFIQDVRGCEIENNTLFNNPGQIILRHALSTGAFSGNNISGNYCVSYPDTQYIMVISSIGPSSAMPRFGYFNNNHYAQLTPSSNFYLADFTNSNTTGSFGSWQSNWGEDIAPSDLLPVNFAPYTVSSYIGSNMYTKGNITLPFLDALLGVRVITSAGIGAIDSGYYYVLNYTMVAPDNAHTMINFLEVGVSPYPQLSPVTSTPTATPSSNNTIVWQAKGTNSNALLVFQINSNVPTLALSNISLYHANVTPNNPANDYIFHYNASNSAVSLPLSGTWEDAAGNTHSGSVSIPAWGSVILISK